MIHTLIIDDEPMARQIIHELLTPQSDFTVIAEAKNGEEGLQLIEKLQPDLIFLDVQMPGIDGLTLLSRLSNESLPLVVFTTAYEEYAISAFERHALDYLLKPFCANRFQASLERIRRHIALHRQSEVIGSLAALVEEHRRRTAGPEHFTVRVNDRILLIPLVDVVRFEADGNYVRLHTSDQSYLHAATIGQIEQQLDSRQFVRIHRSHIVRRCDIRELQHYFSRSYIVILSDGTRLRSGRTYAAAIRAIIGGTD